MVVPAKTDFIDKAEEVEFSDISTPKYYRETRAKKVNKAYNLIKSDPTEQKNISEMRTENLRRRKNRRMRRESVMTPIPSFIRNRDGERFADTTTGNANVLVNEIAKLMDKHIDNYDADFELKIKCDEDETKWLTVNYDVIKVLADIIKDYVD
jgi:hypothetical protein